MIVVMETSAVGAAGRRRRGPAPARAAGAAGGTRCGSGCRWPGAGRGAGVGGFGGPGRRLRAAHGQRSDPVGRQPTSARWPTRTTAPWRASPWAACRPRPSPWSTWISSPTSACSAAAPRPVGGRGRGGPVLRRPAPRQPAARSQDHLQRRHGRSRGLQQEGQGPLLELRHSRGESRRLEKAPGTARCRRDHQQLRLHLPGHRARMADLEKEPLYFCSSPLSVEPGSRGR